MTKTDNETDGIVLLAKKPDITSFSALNSVKKAIGIRKVGHTGTLDSFAQGLLVVCTGRLTRLAGNITEFDKSYKAVIKFGEETDTLEYTGKVIKTAPLPTEEELRKVIPQFTGKIMQQPPVFSAIHVDGQRASDLARGGVATEIPARPVTIFKAEILDVKCDSDNKVQYALIDFRVSKGTYIRSLARDIGLAVGSAAHLVGLYRTAVGDFKVENAAGYSKLNDFTIDNVLNDIKGNLELIARGQPIAIREKFVKGNIPQEELDLQQEIRDKKVDVDKNTAKKCGFEILDLSTSEALDDFRNGRPLRSYMFTTKLHNLECNRIYAVFASQDISDCKCNGDLFTGLIEKNNEGRVGYKFVIN